jgi:hypothetical protein
MEHARGWRSERDLSCDEMGCMICNGDGAEATAEWWLTAVEGPTEYDEDGYLVSGPYELPFDPEDPEELADLLDEDEGCDSP